MKPKEPADSFTDTFATSYVREALQMRSSDTNTNCSEEVYLKHVSY